MTCRTHPTTTRQHMVVTAGLRAWSGGGCKLMSANHVGESEITRDVYLLAKIHEIHLTKIHEDTLAAHIGRRYTFFGIQEALFRIEELHTRVLPGSKNRLGTRDNITTRGCFCSINQLYRPCGHPPAFPQHAHHDWWTNCTTNRGLTCKNTCTRSKTGPSTHARQRSRAAHNRKSGRERRTRTTKTRPESLPGPMWMILHRWV